MREKLFLFTTMLWMTQASAIEKKLVDCRYISPKTTECMPYPSKFMYPKKLSTGKDIDFHKPHKLIISRTVPTIEKPKIMKVITVEDMIEEHLVVRDPSRFSKIKSHSPMKFSSDENITQESKSNTNFEGDLNDIDSFVVQKYPTIKKNLKKQKHIRVSKKYPKYTIVKGDTLSQIAKRFDTSTKKILQINRLMSSKKTLKIGEMVNIPISKYKFSRVLKREKREKKKRLLAQKLAAKKIKIKQHKKRRSMYHQKLLSTVRGKHSLRVHATAYSSHRKQTDKTPFLAAWNNRIRPGMKIIAVSRDLIYKYGLRNGTKVKIQGLPGYYRVRDKMNKRYRKRIDIYMGVNRRKALRWGRRRTVIYW